MLLKLIRSRFSSGLAASLFSRSAKRVTAFLSPIVAKRNASLLLSVALGLGIAHSQFGSLLAKEKNNIEDDDEKVERSLSLNLDEIYERCAIEFLSNSKAINSTKIIRLRHLFGLNLTLFFLCMNS